MFKQSDNKAQVDEPNRASGATGKCQRLLESVPDSVRKCPWKKAENTVLERLGILGKRALKWSLIRYCTFHLHTSFPLVSSSAACWLAFSGYFDPMYNSITLFICKFIRPCLLIYSVRSIVGSVSFQASVASLFSSSSFFQDLFLLHVSNGALMQALWPWRNFAEKYRNRQVE